MKRPAALFARLALITLTLFCFGSVASAFDCVPRAYQTINAAMPCHGDPPAPADTAGSCVLLCGAVIPAATMMPLPVPAPHLAHAAVDADAATRNTTPEPPPPRTA